MQNNHFYSIILGFWFKNLLFCIVALTERHEAEELFLSGDVLTHILDHHIRSHTEPQPHQPGVRVSPEDLIHHGPILLCTPYNNQPIRVRHTCNSRNMSQSKFSIHVTQEISANQSSRHHQASHRHPWNKSTNHSKHSRAGQIPLLTMWKSY